jgi:hypothetical protein
VTSPIERHASRVLLLDEDQRVLLFRVRVDDVEGWITPGALSTTERRTRTAPCANSGRKLATG